MIRCKAWDLMSIYYSKWASEGYLIRIAGGRALYTDACNTKRENIRLDRLDNDLHVTPRYIKWDTPVELVPIENHRL